MNDNSEYRLKYQYDQQHRLGAKWTKNYLDNSKISLKGIVANKIAGIGLSHTKKLTENLSLKVAFSTINRLKVK